MKNLNIYSSVNLAIFGLQTFFFILFFIVPGRLENPGYVLEKLFTVFLLSAAASFSITKAKNKKLKAAAQTCFVLIFFGIYYELSSSFQTVFSGWQDAKLIALDTKIFGGETSLLMQKIVSPYLTEAMMFAYIAYFPFLVVTAYAAYRSASEKGLAEYLFTLSLVYICCYVCFLVFPVAGQMNYMADRYSVPLRGGFFTMLGELIRSRAHFPGGNLPSPHCAAATVMLYILFKYQRKFFYISLPAILLLYVSTVYGRYHYLLDALSGIIISAAVIGSVQLFRITWNIISLVISGITHNPSPSDSLTEN